MLAGAAALISVIALLSSPAKKMLNVKSRPPENLLPATSASDTKRVGKAKLTMRNESELAREAEHVRGT